MRPASLMRSLQVVIHERLGTWAGQLRPRLASSGLGTIRWVETRSTTDLDRAVRASVAPVVVIDLADRAGSMLEDLDVAVQAAPLGLFLVLDPKNRIVGSQVRELGATDVLSGFVPPPKVARIVASWLPTARRRIERDGWAPPEQPEPELWELPRIGSRQPLRP